MVAAELIQRYGCSVSYVLNDPRCLCFTSAPIEGVIPYRLGIRCVVAIGDPVCHPDDADPLTERFCETFAGRTAVFVAAGERFTERCLKRGFGAIQFGEDLVFDPRVDPTIGARGRELRKNLYRATRAGVTVDELHAPDSAIETELEKLARRWLSARHGVQTFMTPVLLFLERRGRRWFYAHLDHQPVGVLSMVRLDALEGWVFEHLLRAPDAPSGTSEILVTHALQTLGTEGCTYASFGLSPLGELGRMEGVGAAARRFARGFYASAASVLELESISRYRRKFASVRSDARYLLFYPPRVTLFEATGILRAFNVSLRW